MKELPAKNDMAFDIGFARPIKPKYDVAILILNVPKLSILRYSGKLSDFFKF